MIRFIDELLRKVVEPAVISVRSESHSVFDGVAKRDNCSGTFGHQDVYSCDPEPGCGCRRRRIEWHHVTSGKISRRRNTGSLECVEMPSRWPCGPGYENSYGKIAEFGYG